MKRFVLGIVWFMIFGYGLWILGASIALSTLPEDADTAVRLAAQEEFGKTFGPYIFIGSIIVAAVGTLKGWLPWTGKQ